MTAEWLQEAKQIPAYAEALLAVDNPRNDRWPHNHSPHWPATSMPNTTQKYQMTMREVWGRIEECDDANIIIPALIILCHEHLHDERFPGMKPYRTIHDHTSKRLRSDKEFALSAIKIGHTHEGGRDQGGRIEIFMSFS